MDLVKYYKIVENCIAKLGVNAEEARAEKPGSWDLSKGSARVLIDVWYIEKEERPYIQIMSDVVEIPASDEMKHALFEELLVINDKLFGCAFTLFKEKIWLKTIRECEGLDESEAFAMLTRVGNYADEYDDYFQEKYTS